MLKKIYGLTFISVTLVFIYEWLLLNGQLDGIIQGVDLINYIPEYKDMNRSTEPGRPISLFLGYTGFSIMLITNLYIFRKKFSFMRNWGNLSGWLDFHILCGALGPIFIIFHTDFKVGGLVSISFWSMIISAVSGVIGKYFYVKIIQDRSALINEATKIEDNLEAAFSKQDRLDMFNHLKLRFRKFFYLPIDEHERFDSSIIKATISSLVSDIKLFFFSRGLKKGIGKDIYKNFKKWALLEKKAYYLNANKKIMGHWHTFHKPFAIFMYVVAIIHIVSSLLFAVTFEQNPPL